MIIKLTELKKIDDKRVEAPLWVNMTQVLYFSKSSKGNDTHISIPGKSYLFVKETPEEIMNMMVPKMTMAEAYAKLEAVLPDGIVNYGAR